MIARQHTNEFVRDVFTMLGVGDMHVFEFRNDNPASSPVAATEAIAQRVPLETRGGAGEDLIESIFGISVERKSC